LNPKPQQVMYQKTQIVV